MPAYCTIGSKERLCFPLSQKIFQQRICVLVPFTLHSLRNIVHALAERKGKKVLYFGIYTRVRHVYNTTARDKRREQGLRRSHMYQVDEPCPRRFKRFKERVFRFHKDCLRAQEDD